MTKSVIVAIAAVLIVGIGGGGYYFGVAKPHKDAVTEFKTAYQPVREANQNLDVVITKAEKQVKNKQEPLKPEVKTKFLDALKQAKKARVNVPKMPKNTADIKHLAGKADKQVNYSTVMRNLTTAGDNYETSVKQNLLVTNPSEKDVIGRLSKVPNLSGIQPATEENDPNESLNKAGGYTSDLFFISPLVTEPVEGNGSLAKGTDGGGCIEIYKTKSDANKRNTYLTAFDGVSMLNPGSHQVIGTVVIRTSRFLSAEQQQTLTSNIITALTEL